MSAPSISPSPWIEGPDVSVDEAHLVRALHEHRWALLRCYGSLPLPDAGDPVEAPVSLLLHLWNRFEPMSGPCPNCRWAALGTSLDLASEQVTIRGRCTGCGRQVVRACGAPVPFMTDLVRSLAGTGLAPAGSCGTWEPVLRTPALLAVLQELGARPLPRAGATP